MWAPVDEGRAVAKKGAQHVWRWAAGWQGDQMRPLRGTPCPCLRAPRGFAMVAVSIEVTTGGAARMGWWTSFAVACGWAGSRRVRRQERLTMTAQEARTRHAGVRFLCDGFFIGFIGFARSSATMLAGTHLPTNRLWSVGGFPCPPRWPM